MTRAPRRPARSQGGMTLIEVVLFMVIVSVGLAGVLSAFNVATAHSADPMVRKQAITIAEQMLEEILLKDYSDALSGPCNAGTTVKCRANTPEDRPNYNDVGDYHGWNQTGVTDLTNTSVAGLGGYTVTVTVADAAMKDIAATSAKLVTVTVAAGGETVALIGYRTAYE